MSLRSERFASDVSDMDTAVQAMEAIQVGGLTELRDLRARSRTASGRGHRDGKVTEAVAGIVIERLGWTRIESDTCDPQARALFKGLSKYEGLKLARNSQVEGLYRAPGRQALVYTEVTGAYASHGRPGLQRSDTAHKISSRLRIMADVADERRQLAPRPVVFTSDLPIPGTEAGGVVLGLADRGLVVVEIDEDTRILDAYTPADLIRLLRSGNEAA